MTWLPDGLSTTLPRRSRPLRRAGRSGRTWRRVLPAAGSLLVAGCEGPQSALDPAGRGAEEIAALFWGLGITALVIWAAVIGLAYYAIHLRPEAHGKRVARLLIIGGGAVFPTIVLTVVLVIGLAGLPRLLEPPPEGSLQIAVSGEQFWWRVRYPSPGGGTVELANELRLPVGESVEVRLESPDVIHSFWVPAIAGKIDMIPGRTNRLKLEPTRTGVFRGACAEYCGEAHALMTFYVVVMERPEFEAWLTHQASDAPAPADPLAQRGGALFLANGCGACHTVRGTEADGVVGPDLTHVGSRVSLGAGILPNEPAALVRWIARTADVKPGVHMPAFGMLPQEDLRALAAYLKALQ